MKNCAWCVCWAWAFTASAQAGGVVVKERATVHGSVCDSLTWSDASGKARSIAVVSGKDKEGHWGGYVPYISYHAAGRLRECKATGGALGGFGHLILHGAHSRGWLNSKEDSTSVKTRVLFKGAHHVIYRVEMEMASSKGPIRATVDYFVRSGRDDFLYAVTFDASEVKGLSADTRSPYIEFDWEGNGQYGDKLSGFGWASANKQFRTTGDSLSAQSAWDWTAECVIPHVIEWKSSGSGDAEIGLIQTQTYAQHDGGSGWWQKQGQSGSGLPENWNCTYQLNAYQGYATKKMTWMMPYGAVGLPAYDVFDYSRKASGYPYQGYSLLCVLDRRSDLGVDATVSEMVSVHTAANLTATKGTVATEGIASAGRTDTVKLEPAGWDHVYAMWTIECSANAANCTLELSKGELPNPTFCLSGYSGSASVSCSLNGSNLKDGKDFFASFDSGTKRLFVTLGRKLERGRNALTFKSAGRR